HASSPVKDTGLVGTSAPQFSIANISREPLTLDRLLQEYKLVILNFWGLRCGACMEEMPHLNDIHRKYKENVIILGVNVDAVDAQFLRQQMDKMGLEIDYEVIPDPEFTLVDMFQFTAAPLTIVIDSEGIIRYRHENFEAGDEKKLEEVVKSLLDGKKVVNK
ncbi:MAG: redoxin domain-containing protein, partial [Deltaproteobacteria bacterium]|nr:redoxin domain-containing protein [Deltaproteobacteria bacterium]